jgi:hypothetical protein
MCSLAGSGAKVDIARQGLRGLSLASGLPYSAQSRPTALLKCYLPACHAPETRHSAASGEMSKWLAGRPARLPLTQMRNEVTVVTGQPRPPLQRWSLPEFRPVVRGAFPPTAGRFLQTVGCDSPEPVIVSCKSLRNNVCFQCMSLGPSVITDR